MNQNNLVRSHQQGGTVPKQWKYQDRPHVPIIASYYRLDDAIGRLVVHGHHAFDGTEGGFKLLSFDCYRSTFAQHRECKQVKPVRKALIQRTDRCPLFPFLLRLNKITRPDGDDVQE
uniref:Uncharacterized protein n=1 Tax=Anopheles merus TaxID=30066 RepID=A0A182VHV6_ANOME